MEITGHLAKCPAKGCKHATRTDHDATVGLWASGECPEHGRYMLKPIWGVEVPEIKCGARCRGATGPSCDCSCGGHNHGINH